MIERTITVTIPERLFLQLEAAARSSAHSLDAVVIQSLERSIPAHLSALLPGELQAELQVMEQLSDAALWAIASSTLAADQIASMDQLILLKQAGTITPSQQTVLTAQLDAADALMVRKAHAFVLLKIRGHHLPPLDELPVPAV